MANFSVFLALLLCFFLLLITSIFVLYTMYIYFMRKKFSHIPGPLCGSFYLGNLPDVQKGIQKKYTTDDLYLEWYYKYGRVFRVFVLHHVTIHAYIPEVVRKALVLENYPKAEIGYRSLKQQFGQRLMGQSLVTEDDHKKWKLMNALFSPAFHRNFLKTCLVQFNASCDLLLKDLIRKANGKTEVCMLEMFNKVSLDSIGKVAFGMDLNVFSEESTRLMNDVKVVSEGAIQNFLRPLLWCNPFKEAVEHRKRVKDAAWNLRKVAQDRITDCIQALQRGEKLDNNILAHILQTSVGTDDGPISHTQLESMVDHFVTFFAAGQETTACLMASTLLKLCQHPEVAYKMKTEVEAVVGDSEYVTFEDLSKLKYTTAVLKEVLRIHPPVPHIIRSIAKDVVWDGLHIPAGPVLVISMMNMGRIKEYVEQPDEFMPSRFLGDESNPYLHFPFSLGPRQCIGKQFAMIEAQVIMAKLMKHLTFDLVPGQELHFVNSVTNKPKDGCLVYIKPVTPKADKLTSLD